MNLSSAVILSGLTAIFSFAVAAPGPPAPPAAEQAARDIETLIRELADESFKIREKASADLWRMGESALAALNEAAASTDPEQAFRARDLLRKIQLHITPDTDPSVIALVERYMKATPSEKAGLLGRMKGKRAWRQMLKLYASETDAEVRERLQEFVNGVAVIAARERLAKGDSATAREFLEMAPADAAGLLALAEYHRSHGSLNEELERAKAIKSRKSTLWQLALHRAAGNIEAARDAATEVGELRLAAAMAALAGDPVPWLRGLPEGFEEDPSASAYAGVAIRRWLGQKIRSADLEPLVDGLTSRRTTERGAAMNALFLLSEVESVEPAFVKSEPFAAFLHFQMLERNDEALKALGLDPENPDYRSWIEKRIARFTDKDIEDQHEATSHAEELVALANFLERKGLHDEAFAAYSGPLAAFAEKDRNGFVDFLGSLFNHPRRRSAAAPLLAKRIGVVWAGDDEKHWEDVVVAGIGDDDYSTKWWDWLAELAPEENRASRLDGLLAVFKIGPASGKLRDKWFERIWKAVEAAPEAERGELAELIAIAAAGNGDVTNCLKAWDLLPEKARGDFNWEQRLLILSAADRWDDAAKVILKQIALFAEAKQNPGVDLHAYAATVLRRAGRIEEADAHDSWVDKLALGNPLLAREISRIYAFGGDGRRSAEWAARAVREADPDSGEFILALEQHADGLLEAGRWKESAAAAELMARMYASTGVSWTEPITLMHHRLQADLSRALANLESNREESIATLERCHRIFINDGSLADHFFPAIRKAGLIREHDQWFAESWDRMAEVIERYPASDNTRNTAAWFASRAMRNLDEAETHVVKALESNPDQAAYLDTMAEIQFAKGDRDKALEWSRLALNHEPNDSQLRRQHERFRADPLPK
jgi:tetratricopeptide (TPR) repeat protein